jgi:hypothetical protein
MGQNQRQRFVISPEIFKSISPEEVNATYKDMLELKIHKPPYRHFDIELDAINVFSPNSISIPKGTQYDGDIGDLIEKTAEQARNLLRNKFNVLIKYNYSDNLNSDEFSVGVYTDKNDGNFKHFKKISETNGELTVPTGVVKFELVRLEGFTVVVLRMFIVLLATKNIIKEVKLNKLAKLGIGKNKHRPWQVTYLKIGKITESVSKSGTPKSGTGIILRPHLRRGHKRDQHYGLGNKYTKSIFIQPTFVNADKEWIADRSEYRVL